MESSRTCRGAELGHLGDCLSSEIREGRPGSWELTGFQPLQGIKHPSQIPVRDPSGGAPYVLFILIRCLRESRDAFIEPIEFSLCSFFFFFNLFIYLFIHSFMAVLGLHFCARAFSSCGKWGPLFITVRGPLTVAASLVAEHRLQTRRLSNCGSRT